MKSKTYKCKVKVSFLFNRNLTYCCFFFLFLPCSSSVGVFFFSLFCDWVGDLKASFKECSLLCWAIEGSCCLTFWTLSGLAFINCLFASVEFVWTAFSLFFFLAWLIWLHVTVSFHFSFNYLFLDENCFMNLTDLIIWVYQFALFLDD